MLDGKLGKLNYSELKAKVKKLYEVIPPKWKNFVRFLLEWWFCGQIRPTPEIIKNGDTINIHWETLNCQELTGDNSYEITIPWAKFQLRKTGDIYLLSQLDYTYLNGGKKHVKAAHIIREGETRIVGRESDDPYNSFELEDLKAVSRKHFSVTILNWEPIITDLNSTNGTTVNFIRGTKKTQEAVDNERFEQWTDSNYIEDLDYNTGIDAVSLFRPI